MGETLDYVSHFMSVLAASCVLYNRTRLLYLFYKKGIPYIPHALLSIFKTNLISKANNSVVSILYTLTNHATMSQSESVLEWFTESDWQSKMRAVQNDKPSKFTIYNGSQSETVRKVKFDTFA